MNAIPFSMTLPELRNPDQLALFLDFDGTLVAIASRPDDVQLDPETREALANLNELLAGALAMLVFAAVSSARSSFPGAAALVEGWCARSEAARCARAYRRLGV